MAFYMIGIGLNDEKDITVRGLEILKKCNLVYFENYTSVLNVKVKSLEKLYGKKIIEADRRLIEENYNEILNEAKDKDVALLVVGDALGATTHIDLMIEAKKKGIKTVVINNASIITAVGIVGLQLYKYGKITSIPFHESKSYFDVLKFNLKSGLHTLFLLDLNPDENKFLTIKGAINKLLDLNKKGGKKIINEKTLFIGCARVGSENPQIKVGTSSELLKIEFGRPPYCLIVPGKLHFMEKEALEMWK